MEGRRVRILEVIQLRLASHELEPLTALIADMVDQGRAESVRVYRHSRIETDLLVHLHREALEGDDSRSELGSRLASVLREHGLVEHSVWMEHARGASEGRR